MNEIESIRTHLQDYYAQLINAMRVSTYLKHELQIDVNSRGITPETELRKLDVITATNGIVRNINGFYFYQVDACNSALTVINEIRLSLVLSDHRIGKK